MRARVSNVYPFVDKDAQEAFGAAASDDDGDADDPFASDDGEPDDEELLTKEELEAMDLKELGGVAKDFDIDPNEFVHKVRGKTKVKVEELIEAILEAQGEDDGETGDGETGEDEDDDESPF